MSDAAQFIVCWDDRREIYDFIIYNLPGFEASWERN
jgi:hypothetical protein